MEKRFEVFVEDIYAIKRLTFQKERVEYNLRETSFFDFKRKKMLEKSIERYESILENHYKNLIRKINKLTFKEFIRIIMHTSELSVKAYRYAVDENDFYEMLKIYDKKDNMTVYCGYNKSYFYKGMVAGFISKDIPELLSQNSVNPMNLIGIDKIDVMLSISNYEEVMIRFYKSFIKFLFEMFNAET